MCNKPCDKNVFVDTISYPNSQNSKKDKYHENLGQEFCFLGRWCLLKSQMIYVCDSNSTWNIMIKLDNSIW